MTANTLRFLLALALAGALTNAALVLAQPAPARLDCAGRLQNPALAGRAPERIELTLTADGTLAELSVFAEGGEHELKRLTSGVFGTDARSGRLAGRWRDGTALDLSSGLPAGPVASALLRGGFRYEGTRSYRVRCQLL